MLSRLSVQPNTTPWSSSMTDRDDDCEDLPILIRIPRIVLERAARRQTETARAEDEVLDDERGRLCSFCKKTGEAIAAGALPDDRNGTEL